MNIPQICSDFPTDCVLKNPVYYYSFPISSLNSDIKIFKRFLVVFYIDKYSVIGNTF